MALVKKKTLFRMDFYVKEDKSISRVDMVRSITMVDDVTDVPDDDIGERQKIKQITDGSSLSNAVKQALRDFIDP